jgi:hypothetical protein
MTVKLRFMDGNILEKHEQLSYIWIITILTSQHPRAKVSLFSDSPVNHRPLQSGETPCQPFKDPPCLWFDDQAEEIARLYTSSSELEIVSVTRYGRRVRDPQEKAEPQ